MDDLDPKDLPPPHLFLHDPRDSKPFDFDAYLDALDRIPDHAWQAIQHVQEYFASGQQYAPDSSLTKRMMESLGLEE